MASTYPDDVVDLYADDVMLSVRPGETDRQFAWRSRAATLQRTPVGALAARQGFVMTRAQAAQLGTSAAEQRRRVRSGAWHVPGRGCLAPFPRGDVLDQQALAATSIVLRRQDTAVGQRSAAVLHDLPLINVPGVPFERPELSRIETGRQCREPGLHIRTAPLPPDHRTDWYGAPVTSIARTVIDLARLDRRQGLVAADAALGSGRVDRADLMCVAEFAARWPGAAVAREVVRLASPLAESPLESLVRLLLHDGGIPSPDLQRWITDPADGWPVRVDMSWPDQRLILEADGRLKYTRDELWKEKRRQERLERLGWRVIRVLWRDMSATPDELVARVVWALSFKPAGETGLPF